MGKPRLELGHALDLARHQNTVVEQQAVSALLDHLQPLGLQVVATRRRQAQLAARREHDAALTPRVGVDHQRQSRAPLPTDQPLETAVVVGMAMRDDDRAQVAHRHLEHVEVARHRMRP